VTVSASKNASSAVTGTSPDAVLAVYVSPRAGRTEIAGEREGALWIKLAAPPVDGAANEALVRFLAGRLDVAGSRVRIAAGANAHRKRVRIEGLSLDEVEQRLGRRTTRQLPASKAG
jgi:uncharacterized protein